MAAMDLRRDTKRRLIAVSVLVFVLVSLIGYALDRYLVRDGINRFQILMVSNALTGIVAGLLFYTLAFNERMRRAQIHHRLSTIAEMNHHIRNALQVITYATATGKDSESMELIQSSVDRIEWALREVLPGEGSTGAPVEQQQTREKLQVG
jgi:uncharacterized membrane protein